MKAQGLCALILGLSLCNALLPASRCAARADQTPILLDDLDLAGMAQGWGSPQASASVSGAPLRVAGESFDSGVGTHAPAAWKLPLAGKATEFRGTAASQAGGTFNSARA